MAQTTRSVKSYNGQTSFTAGRPTAADWNLDLDTLFAAYNAHDANTTAVHGVGTGAVVGTALTQTLTNKTLTAPVLSGTATGTYVLAGTVQITNPTIAGTIIGSPTITSPDVTGTVGGSALIGGTIRVPLARVGVSGSYTTASLAQYSGDTRAITHSLTTDAVKVILHVVGSGAGEIKNDWAIASIRPDGATTKVMGPYSSAAVAISMGANPASGDVKLLVVNMNATAQTITVYYSILRES